MSPALKRKKAVEDNSKMIVIKAQTFPFFIFTILNKEKSRMIENKVPNIRICCIDVPNSFIQKEMITVNRGGWSFHISV